MEGKKLLTGIRAFVTKTPYIQGVLSIYARSEKSKYGEYKGVFRCF